ncbi:DUF6003 family protein [Streptomyces hypolithicus]
MADDALLFLLPDRHVRVGAALAAAGPLECTETSAVRAWLHAHGAEVLSEYVRIVPADAETLVPQDAERLPVPLSEEEAVRVQQECAPQAVRDVEAELLEFRDTTQDWAALVHRALSAGVPQAHIARLTGLDPQAIVRLTQ